MSGKMHPAQFARWASATVMALGGLLMFAYFFESPWLISVRLEATDTLLRAGLFVFFFGASLMLSQVFGENQRVEVKGVVFAGTLGILWGFLYLVNDFIIPPNRFSHPDLDLVVICRTEPGFAEGVPLTALVNLSANKQKVSRVKERSKILSQEEFSKSFTHLQEPGETSVYIKPAVQTGTRSRFEIYDLLPISSSDQIRVLLTTATQTGVIKDYVIFSSYLTTEPNRRLVAEVNLEEAGDVCKG